MVALDSEQDALERGDAAPAFDLPATDGETYSPSEFGNHEALLVVFTCNHCPYAQAKFEAMNAIARDYEDVAVLGINPNDAEEYPEDSFETMQAYVERGDVDITAYLRDESQAVAEAYGAVCTPDPFLFRNEGSASTPDFRLVYHGRFDDAQNPDDEPSGQPGFELRAVIEDVLAGRSPDAEFRPARGCSIKWQD